MLTKNESKAILSAARNFDGPETAGFYEIRIRANIQCGRDGVLTFVESAGLELPAALKTATVAMVKRFNANRRQRANAKATNDAMRSIGMKRVRGIMGGTYFE